MKANDGPVTQGRSETKPLDRARFDENSVITLTPGPDEYPEVLEEARKRFDGFNRVLPPLPPPSPVREQVSYEEEECDPKVLQARIREAEKRRKQEAIARNEKRREKEAEAAKPLPEKKKRKDEAVDMSERDKKRQKLDAQPSKPRLATKPAHVFFTFMKERISLPVDLANETVRGVVKEMFEAKDIEDAWASISFHNLPLPGDATLTFEDLKVKDGDTIELRPNPDKDEVLAFDALRHFKEYTRGAVYVRSPDLPPTWIKTKSLRSRMHEWYNTPPEVAAAEKNRAKQTSPRKGRETKLFDNSSAVLGRSNDDEKEVDDRDAPRNATNHNDNVNDRLLRIQQLAQEIIGLPLDTPNYGINIKKKGLDILELAALTNDIAPVVHLQDDIFPQPGENFNDTQENALRELVSQFFESHPAMTQAEFIEPIGMKPSPFSSFRTTPNYFRTANARAKWFHRILNRIRDYEKK